MRRFQVGPGMSLVADEWGRDHSRSVLMLHGGGQTRHAWQGTGRILAARGWHVLCIDMRGHGDSDWAPDKDYTITAFSHDVRRVAEELGNRPVLVGASLGGISSLIAIGETEHAISSGIVLVDIAARIEKSGADKIVGFMRAHTDGFDSPEQAADVIAEYLPHRKRPKDLSGLSKNLRKHPDGRYRWHWDPEFMQIGRDQSNTDSFPGRMDAAARSLSVPTLLVRGRMSDLLSEEGAQHFLELVPHAQYVDVSGAGHMIAGDRNEVFSQAVCDFLATLQ